MMLATLFAGALAAGCGSEVPAQGAGDGNGQTPGVVTGPVFGLPTGTGGAGGAGGTGGASPTFCDALTVMQGSCHDCHGAARQYGAPMSLVTYQDLMAPAVSDPSRKVYELVGVRIHDTASPMPVAPWTISPEGVATLDQWIAAGAPAGVDPSCASQTNTLTGGTGGGPAAGEGGAGGEVIATGGTGGGNGEFTWPADCEEFYTLTAYQGSKDNPATIAANSETHPQFYFDVPWTGEVQALAFRSITDNSKVLHHWILYGPNSGGLGGENKFLVGWAPGKEDRGGLPDDVGMYMPSSGRMRLDVHYFNKGAGAVQEQDASGVEVCVTHTFRKYTATVMGLMGNASIPAGQSVDNRSSCVANVTGGEPVRVLSVSPHMHRLGTNAYLSHTPSGTVMERVLHDAPFDFEDQRVYPLDNVVVGNGDRLTTICSYTNTTNSSVQFGDSTTDEMCINFITYYPMGAMTCGFTI